MRSRLMRSRLMRAAGAAGAAGTAACLLLTACDLTPGAAAQIYGAGSPGPGTIVAVGAESQYADVIGEVGGRYVRATAIMSNPNTDPHAFEASAKVAQQVGDAQLIVQSGLGYDSFMNSLESAAPSTSREVITVQRILKLPDSTPNPHLWYKPGVMAAVATAIAADLTRIQPAHAAYFTANATQFARSLTAWNTAISAFKTKYPATRVATTEPVADYLLDAAGADDLTPWAFQADLMNGTDPSAQDVAAVRDLLTGHKVSAFVYNTQVTDSLTQSFVNLAQAAGVPVIGVYETMPAPGYDYQSWMLAEVRALTKAVASQTSTERL